MPTDVYDKKKEEVQNKPGDHDDLGLNDEGRKVETNSLNDDFYRDEGPDLQALESEPGSFGAGTKGSEKESDQIGPGYNPEDSGGRLSTIKKTITNSSKKAKLGVGGGMIGGVAALMSLFGFGSLQAVHLSQLLSLDNQANEKTSEVRMNALYRYVKSGGNVGETRVSYLGSKSVAKSNARLATIGISFSNNPIFGVNKGMIIDIDKNPVTQGKSPAEARKAMVDRYKSLGVTNSNFRIDGNRLIVDDKGSGKLSIAVRAGLVDDATAQLGDGKVSTWMKARQIKKFLNLPSAFHPLKRIDANVTEKIEERFKAKQALRDAEKARGEARQSTRVGKYEAARASLNEKLSGARAVTGGALLITASTCIARSAANEAATFNREAVVLPQVLEATDKIAIGAQQQSGQDFDASQLAVINELMSDENGSVFDAQALKAKRESNPNGEDIPWDYAQAFNEDSDIATLKDLGGTAGKAACSTTGQIVQGAVGLVFIGLSLPTGGGTAVAYGALKAGGSAVAGVAIMAGLHELLSKNLKEDRIPFEEESATVRGGLMAYGSRELANINQRAAGGIELSDQESAAIDQDIIDDQANEFSERSMFAKVFDVHDYRSLSANVIQKANPRPGAQVRSMARSITSFKLPSFAAILPSKVSAQSPGYDYGFNRYGIPQKVLNDPKLADPYTNAEELTPALKENAGKIVDRAKACFGVSIKQISGAWGSVPETEVNPNSEAYAEANCSDISDFNWVRTIIFVRDTSEAEAAACYEGDEESCEIIGMNPPSATSSLSSGAGGDVRIATYNILGASHSDPGGNKPQRPDSGPRMVTTIKIIKDYKFDIVGLQEFEKGQRADLLSKIGDQYAISPGKPIYGGDGRASANSIIWDKNKFDKVEEGVRPFKYFGGSTHELPWVRLKFKSGGQEIIVSNTHDPANARGPARDLRNTNAETHVAWTKEMVAKYGVPVFITGDYNSRYESRGGKKDYGNELRSTKLPYCILTNAGVLASAFDVWKKKTGPCPSHKGDPGVEGSGPIDHIFITPTNVSVTGWEHIHNGETRFASDHDPVYTDIAIEGVGDDVATDLPSKDGWVWPVPGVKSMGILGYGEGGSRGIHKGIDIGISGGAALNKEVVAAHDGEVVQVSGQTSACGAYIVIKATGTPYYAAYQHVASTGIKVSEKDTVKAGQIIGSIGRQGGSTCGSPNFFHLHFSIESSNTVSEYADPFPNGTINPLSVLPK